MVCPHHQYPLDLIYAFVQLVSHTGAGFRGVAPCLTAWMSLDGQEVGSPSYSAGRLWWLRLGCYKLTRALPAGKDWVWLVDHERREALLHRAVMKGHRHPVRRSGLVKLRAA